MGQIPLPSCWSGGDALVYTPPEHKILGRREMGQTPLPSVWSGGETLLSTVYSPWTLDHWDEGGGTNPVAFWLEWWRDTLVYTPPGH